LSQITLRSNKKAATKLVTATS